MMIIKITMPEYLPRVKVSTDPCILGFMFLETFLSMPGPGMGSTSHYGKILSGLSLLNSDHETD